MEDPTAAPLTEALRAHAEGRVDTAEALCRTILETALDHAGALNLLGLIANGRGETALALDLARRACAGPTPQLLHLMNYAELCRKSGFRQEAEDAAQRATVLYETAALAWFCLGNMLLEIPDFPGSRRCYEQALARQPEFVQARNNLAIVLGRLGEIEAAVVEFETLLAAAPENGEAYSNLALQLQTLGRFEEALAAAEKAIELQPEAPVAYATAAAIEMNLGRYWSALATIGLAQRIRADDPQCLLLKAHLLRLVDHFDDAVACCREAFALGIETPDMLHAYALALHMAGASDEALAAYDRAASAAANPARAVADKAVLLNQLGRLDDALASFEDAIAHDPALAIAWYNKAGAKRFTLGDPDVAAMARLLTGTVDYQDRLWLNFSLAKAHLDLGDGETGFAHLDEANRLKRGIVDYDADEAEAHVARIAAVPIDFDELAALTHPDRLSELPVFVVGMPRSGSSLVEQILASHPEVHGGGELLRLSGFIEEAAWALDGADADHAVDGIAEGYLAKLRGIAPEARRIIDKDLTNFLHVGIIHRVFPRARVIHCRRDPLDTCFSAYTKLFQGGLNFTYDQTELGRHYRDYDALMAHWRRVLPPHAFIEVEYEALVGNMEGESRRLLDFIGLGWDEACLRFFETARVVRTASLEQVRRPIYQSSIGRALPYRRQLQPLIAALGDLVPKMES
jgi:tetratricopeptide (TPR) repeat protein